MEDYPLTFDILFAELLRLLQALEVDRKASVNPNHFHLWPLAVQRLTRSWSMERDPLVEQGPVPQGLKSWCPGVTYHHRL